MFKIVKTRKIWWPVKVSVAQDDGRVEDHSFSMRFKMRDVDGNLKLLHEASDLGGAADGGKKDGQRLGDIFASYAKKLADDWRDVVDAGDGALKFSSDDDLALVMGQPGVFEAVLSAYRDCSNGVEASPSGN